MVVVSNMRRTEIGQVAVVSSELKVMSSTRSAIAPEIRSRPGVTATSMEAQIGPLYSDARRPALDFRGLCHFYNTTLARRGDGISRRVGTAERLPQSAAAAVKRHHASLTTPLPA
jgi:hypothetical protein